MTLIYIAACFLAGVYAGSLVDWPAVALLLLGAAALAALVLRRRRPGARLLSACLLVFLAGMLRFGSAGVGPGPEDVSRLAGGREVRLLAVVAEPPDVRDARVNLRVSVLRVVAPAGGDAVSGRLQVTLPRYPEYRYGDVLELAGRVQLAPVFEDFSYRDYLARQGVYAVMYAPRVDLREQDAGNPVLARLYALRSGAEGVLASAVAEPQAGLAAGVLLGTRRALPPDLTAALQAAGLTHIVVVSGFNLSIIAGVLTSLTRRRLGPRASLATSVLAIAAFTLLVGAGAAVVRAALMVTLGMVGMALGRQNSGPTAVAASAGLMVAWEPMQLWDVGFQLSVAATIGLVWLAPILEARIRRLPGALRANLAVALAAQIMTLPLIAGNFGRVSVVAPAANLAVLWAVPWLMLSAVVTIIVGAISAAAAPAAGWAAWLSASAILAPAQGLAALPAAAVDLPAIAAPWWVAYYGLVLAAGAWAAAGAGRQAGDQAGAAPAGRSFLCRRAATAALAVAAVLLWSAAAALPDGKLHVWFLDVGEGDATLIRAPGGQVVLVDGGPSPVAIANALGRVLPFWQRDLDLVVLSHANEDHLLGLAEVARRYRIEQTIEPAVSRQAGSYGEWDRAVAAAGARRVVAEQGQRVDLGHGAFLEVLWPRGGAPTGQSENQGSVVLRLVYGQVSVLLPGDIDAETGRQIAAAGGGMSGTVLKVPHHGARSSLDAAFLRAVAPQAAVLSVGAGNDFGHPAPETLALLGDLPAYRTDLNGTVELVTDGESWTISPER